MELGLLPGLVEIGIAREENRHDAIVVRRSGSTVEAQEVLVDVTARDRAGNSLGLFQRTLVIPAGAGYITRSLRDLQVPSQAVFATVEIVPNGRTYVVGSDRRVEIH